MRASFLFDQESGNGAYTWMAKPFSNKIKQMKRPFIYIITISLFSLALFSCKEEKTVKDMLQGRWNFDRQIVNVIIGGTNTTDTTYADPGDFVDFRSDNTVVSYLYGAYDSTVYEVLGKDKLVIGQTDTIGIRSIFSNSLVLGNTELNGPDDFYEIFIYFYR